MSNMFAKAGPGESLTLGRFQGDSATDASVRSRSSIKPFRVAASAAPVISPAKHPAGWDHGQIEQIPAAACVCDRRGVIVDYNSRASDLWGRSPERGDVRELYCGFTHRYRRDGSILPRDNAPMAHALVTGRGISDFELTVERPDRSRRTVLVNVALLRDWQGAITGAISCFNDITEWKQMAEALHQTALLEALQRLTGDVAHNYSNVLAAIASNLNMAKKRTTEAAALKFIDGGIHSAERGLDYTLRLRAFAHEPQIVPDVGDIDGLLAQLAMDSDTGAARVAAQTDAQDKTVLLVDDDSKLREVARDALSSLGFGVVDADGGEAALGIIRSGRPLRLMIVDVGMVPMNGVEFLQHAREIRPELKALMMTGHPDVPTDLNIGPLQTAVLRKPFGIDELAESLNRLIA